MINKFAFEVTGSPEFDRVMIMIYNDHIGPEESVLKKSITWSNIEKIANSIGWEELRRGEEVAGWMTM